MAAAFDQAKMKFSKIVNSRSYTRFNQSQNHDGESSRVEVKLDTEEEEIDGVEQGHVRHETYTKPISRSGSRNKWRVFILVSVVVLIFCMGLLIGYSVHGKSRTQSCPTSGSRQDLPSQEDQLIFDSPESTMEWNDVVKLLNAKLSPEDIQSRISEFSGDRKAGSYGDSILADKIHDTFEKLHMNPWVDEHFVKLQTPHSSNPNKVRFGSDDIGSPKGFLAYSKTGSKQGRIVYANYGEPQDLTIVEENRISLNGSVVLLRAGKISMAQKVANVASKGAVAALIYLDPADYDTMSQDTELYGHVHLGSGDPYTPGFPSFNHTQFPPTKSSGLPDILAQTITANMALKIFDKMGGSLSPESFQGRFSSYKLGSESDLVTVEVNNELVDTMIHNVFGVIKGFVDTDRYVVIGAQRDSLGPGYAKSAVGTTLLMELARAFSEMEKGGFKPKRSIVFASWSAGDFGNVGVTEWLEGYAASLDKKAFTYISLDGVVTGVGSFKASASPLLHNLLKKTLEKVKVSDGSHPVKNRQSLFQSFGGSLSSVLKPMEMDDAAYPFLAFSGIPSVSFSFTSSGAKSNDYKYYGTALDDKDHLSTVTGQKVGDLSMAAAQVAGQMALRLVHDHVLTLDVTKYGDELENRVNAIVGCTNELKRAKVDKSESLSTEWLIVAKASYQRATISLQNTIRDSNLEDLEMSRIINNRIMKVEHNFLSAYVSLRDVPFRHVFFGNGWQTASDLENYLKDVRARKTTLDIDQVLNKFALLTWTIQGCANDLAGDIWSFDNEI